MCRGLVRLGQQGYTGVRLGPVGFGSHVLWFDVVRSGATRWDGFVHAMIGFAVVGFGWVRNRPKGRSGLVSRAWVGSSMARCASVGYDLIWHSQVRCARFG